MPNSASSGVETIATTTMFNSSASPSTFHAATSLRPPRPVATSAATISARGAGDDVEVAPGIAHLLGHDAALEHPVHRQFERQPEPLHGDQHPERDERRQPAPGAARSSAAPR